MTPSQTSGVDALARPTKVVEGLSAMPMISVQSYISRSITEFWRRWHMTLSGWFRK